MTDKIICIGKNYLDHVHELGDKPVKKPVIFIKPPSVLRQCQNWGDTLSLSLPKDEIEYECEIVFKLREDMSLGWYTLGLDMTKRKLQNQLKTAGHPWTICKVFPDAAIIGPWVEIINDDYLQQTFHFSLNQERRQNITGANMLMRPKDILPYVNDYFLLVAGDIIYTGTPSGVGPVKKGDVGKVEMGEFHYFVEW